MLLCPFDLFGELFLGAPVFDTVLTHFSITFTAACLAVCQDWDSSDLSYVSYYFLPKCTCPVSEGSHRRIILRCSIGPISQVLVEGFTNHEVKPIPIFGRRIGFGCSRALCVFGIWL